jgi:hypothetical protein
MTVLRTLAEDRVALARRVRDFTNPLRGKAQS